MKSQRPWGSKFRDCPYYPAGSHIPAPPTCPSFAFDSPPPHPASYPHPNVLCKPTNCSGLNSSNVSSVKLSLSSPSTWVLLSSAPITPYTHPTTCPRTHPQTSSLYQHLPLVSGKRSIYILLNVCLSPWLFWFQVYMLYISFWMFMGIFKWTHPILFPLILLLHQWVSKITTHSVVHEKNSKVIFHSFSLTPPQLTN